MCSGDGTCVELSWSKGHRYSSDPSIKINSNTSEIGKYDPILLQKHNLYSYQLSLELHLLYFCVVGNIQRRRSPLGSKRLCAFASEKKFE